jgi:formylglycine-generating enzyme required for sulfatase activity
MNKTATATILAVVSATLALTLLFATAETTALGDSRAVLTSPTPPKATEADQLLWDELSRQDTKAGYEFYLKERPSGFYAAEARKRIEAFDAGDERRKLDSALAEKSRTALENFLRNNPGGRYMIEALETMRKFDRTEEDARWKAAEETKSVEGYVRYLARHPYGAYVGLARLRLSTLGGVPLEMVRRNTFGMEFSWIPAGDFLMGSPSTERLRDSDEEPQRLVTIRQGFWMGRHEVTQGQYEAVMGTNPSFFKNCGRDCPVERVSWNDAKEFIRRLNQRNDGFVYSLPTEAEWEYAARAGTTTAFAFGDSLSSNQANFNGNNPYGNAAKGPYLERTRTVGSYEPNAWGLYDMHGNVREWVEDIYQDSYARLPTDGTANTTSGDASLRMLRGGSWNLSGFDTRSTDRYRNMPTVAVSTYGFRLVARAR